jgi:hypothetical protein
MANEIEGYVECEACGNQANIKRKATGKKLLYIHCPKCGLDQRSGDKMQAKLNGILKGETLPAEREEQATETNFEQWKPSEDTHRIEIDENEPKKIKSTFKIACGSLLTVVTIAGFLLTKGIK